MRRVALDTNSYSRLFRGERYIAEQLAKAEQVLISSIALGELYHGFFRGEMLAQNEIRLRKFLRKSSVKIVDITLGTARIYGMIKNNLWQKGLPIPTNDLWIAASSIETDSILITYDKHFLKIPGIKIWKYI